MKSAFDATEHVHSLFDYEAMALAQSAFLQVDKTSKRMISLFEEHRYSLKIRLAILLR